MPEGVGEEKRRVDEAKIGIAETELLDEHRSGDSERLAVEVVDRRDQTQ
jgi:hypothetical protein